MAEIWGAAIVAGVGLVGSYMSAQGQKDAANKAAQAQENAANQSNATLMQMYNQSRDDLAPWRTTGGGALNQLAALNGIGTGANGANGAPDYSAFMNSPDYQFALQQGIGSLDASAASRGRLYSGGYGRDLTQYAQGLATQNLNNYENRLMGLSQQGQQAGEFGGQLAMQTAMGYGNNLMNAGNAAASGYINNANANTGMYNQLGQMAGYVYGNYMNQPQSGYQNAAIDTQMPMVQPNFNVQDGVGIPMGGAPNPYASSPAAAYQG